MTPADLREHVLSAKAATGLSWAAIAEALDRPPAWTVAALFGMHPMPAEVAAKAGTLLDLAPEAVSRLQREPYRVAEPDLLTDPTIYRFHEALTVYGPAIKELIHEEFGDGIMSAINFKLDVSRRADPDGDRVVVTFDGKFLDYRW
ncbi:cyanase [Lapillicoccus sp.]|jgi:cyanate lyase|uniref:cyanase n=1 Tax=Lapillicoccus sp. TaxID=1909287 RepID=UPI0025E3963E|nr:cyanase [Lapillicoccus sp.]